MGAPTPVYKIKIWKCTYADNKFSQHIRKRDSICRRCKRAQSTDCSHYWLRKHSKTRFDPQNCVGLCRPCHDIWEHQKNNEYKDFMIEWLGKEEYDLLEIRARSFQKRVDAILGCMVLLSV